MGLDLFDRRVPGGLDGGLGMLREYTSGSEVDEDGCALRCAEDIGRLDIAVQQDGGAGMQIFQSIEHGH